MGTTIDRRFGRVAFVGMLLRCCFRWAYPISDQLNAVDCWHVAEWWYCCQLSLDLDVPLSAPVADVDDGVDGIVVEFSWDRNTERTFEAIACRMPFGSELMEIDRNEKPNVRNTLHY